MQSILREAALGFRARISILLIISLFYSTIIAGFLFLVFNERGIYENSLQENAARGAFVIIASDKSGQLDSTECSALSSVPGVKSVGAVYSEKVSSLNKNPGEQVRVVDAQPSAIWIFTGIWATNGAVVGSTIERQFGYVSGDAIGFSDGISLRVDSAFSQTSRSEGKSAWVYRSTRGAPTASKCVIETEPDLLRSYASILPSRFPTAKSLEFSTLSPNAQPDIESRWQSGLHKNAWVVATILILLGAVASTFIRRKEIALYAMLGMSRIKVYGILSLQSAISIYVSLLLGITWMFAVADGNVWSGALRFEYSLPILCMLVGTNVAAASLAAVLAVLQDPARVLRDRS